MALRSGRTDTRAKQGSGGRGLRQKSPGAIRARCLLGALRWHLLFGTSCFAPWVGSGGFGANHRCIALQMKKLCDSDAGRCVVVARLNDLLHAVLVGHDVHAYVRAAQGRNPVTFVATWQRADAINVETANGV